MSASSNHHRSSSNANSNVRTTVSILLNNSSNSNKAAASSQQGANVVLWAQQQQQTTSGSSNNNAAAGSSSSSTLTYFHYWDHAHLFQHTDALLQRLPNVVAVHVASTASPSSQKNKQQGGADNNNNNINNEANSTEPDRLTHRLLQSVEDSLKNASLLAATNDSADMEDDSMDDAETANTAMDPTAAAPENVLQFHANFRTPSAADIQTRLPAVIQTLLGNSNSNNNNNAWMQFCGDLQWQRHPVIAHGLVWHLQAGTTHWPAVSSDDRCACVTHIGAGSLDSCLTIDSTAADAIHLWPAAPHHGGTAATNSLYGMLAAHCQTASGKWLLQQWLRQPSVHLPELVQRQDAVETLVQCSAGRDAVRSEGLRLFGGSGSGSLGDLARLAATLATYANAASGSGEEDVESDDMNESENSGGKKINTRRALMALYQLYLVSSQKVPLLTEHLQMVLVEAESSQATSQDETSSSSSSSPPSLLADIFTTLQQVSSELERSIELVEAVLDLDQAPREYLVQSDYKQELQDILQDLQQCDADLEDCHSRMGQLWAEASGTDNPQAVRLEQSDDGTWLFRLPDTNGSKILTKQLAGKVTICKMLKNGVSFTNKQLRQLSQHQRALRAEYDRHQLQVVRDAAAVAATYAPVLDRAAEAVAHLDVVAALAHSAAYAEHGGYCRPQLTDSDEDGAGIVLKQARHPCVEKQEGVDFIPNDYDLTFGESSFLLVTGPNMGGKSTYIRALGAIVTLAQIGSFVPCSAAKINICHHILARVGAGDLQERGISTFMAEMLESASILRTATKRSLIIVDELGRGTSTFDGYGLACAISEYIVQEIGCITVFATHFHELTALEEKEKSVKNCHVTAQKGSQGLTFLYEVKPGPCLESFGIQVAAMANVPHSVIQDAKRRARALENFEYRKKSRTSSSEGGGNNNNTASTSTSTKPAHSEEELAAARAWRKRVNRIPKDFFRRKFASNAEKRAALLEAMGE